MARGGHKYPLLLYQHLVNRWWGPMFAIGLVMFGIAFYEYNHPIYHFISWRWQVLGGLGFLSFFTGIFFLVIRQVAYVQPMHGYLKFVTPFLRMNISNKRIHKTTVTEMRQLFPPKSLSYWVRDIINPLASNTVLVIELKSYPIPSFLLRMFLSRFFFKDNTPHLVILVKDWMRLSGEIDSFRSGVPQKEMDPREKALDSILSKLPRK